MPGTVDLGIADDGECSDHEQAVQIAVIRLSTEHISSMLDDATLNQLSVADVTRLPNQGNKPGALRF